MCHWLLPGMHIPSEIPGAEIIFCFLLLFLLLFFYSRLLMKEWVCRNWTTKQWYAVIVIYHFYFKLIGLATYGTLPIIDLTLSFNIKLNLISGITSLQTFTLMIHKHFILFVLAKFLVLSISLSIAIIFDSKCIDTVYLINCSINK